MDGIGEVKFTPDGEERECDLNDSYGLEEEPGLRRSARDRSLTEKGLSYKISQMTDELEKRIVTLNKQTEAVNQLLSQDRSDVEQLCMVRDQYEHELKGVNQCYKYMVEFTKGQVDYKTKERFERIDTESRGTLWKLSDVIRQLKMETRSHISNYSGRSVAARSVRSFRSVRSSLSRGSNSKLAEAAANVAELQARAKFMEVESRQRAELEKLKVEKSLEVARARFDVLSRYEDFEVSVPVSQGFPVLETRPREVDQYHALDFSTKPKVSEVVRGFNALNEGEDLSTKTASGTAKIEACDVFSHGHEGVVGSNPVIQNDDMVNQNQNNVGYGSKSSTVQSSGVDPSQILIKTLCDQLALSRLPLPEPGVFSGDALEYPSWKRAFETLVASRSIPKDECLHYLKRYLGGDAKACVEGCFVLNSSVAYDDAMRLLEERFGNSFVIGNAFRDKLDKWPKVAGSDSVGLRRYVDFLKQCQSAMKSIGSLKVLDDDRENRKMLLKLPGWLTNRWARIVSDWKSSKGEFPPFSSFVQFLSKEADIANDPITSLQSSKGSNERSGGSSSKTNRFKRGTSLKTVVENSSKTVNGSNGSVKSAEVGSDSTKTVSCLYCQRDHSLNSCEEFRKQPIDVKQSFARNNKLCFRCLGRGHHSKKCLRKWKCDVCSGPHATALHDPDFRSKIMVRNSSLKANATPFNPPCGRVTDASGFSDACSGAISMQISSSVSLSSMIVPVYLSHSDNPSQERLVYALLDSQSDTSFVLDSTCKALGVSGTEVELSLSTMISENKIIKTEKVKGFSARGFDSEEKVDLPTLYTRNVMPANRSHIPSAEMAERWSHLRVIKDKLMPVSSCEIGLLIGYNCSRALIPRKVIAPMDDGPYAQKTDLGWGIVGVVNQVDVDESDSIGFSHRILTYPVLDSNKSVSFSVQSSVKELVNPRDALKVLEGELSDVEQGVGLSIDERFLEIMRNEVKQLDDGHYEMPLPFKCEPDNLANNIVIAQRRLNCLKSKFERDLEYKKDYVKFMEDMFQSGYAEKVPRAELERDRAWFIPHHGVYNTQKKKIRVVFDCSSKFRGMSLNDCLLQGPDLTNSLMGVLCRFREDYVAFMCDITKMFYQFRVRVDQRDFLRFLWWENGDTSLEPVQYRMTVHIFGATSSPGCSNFGLRQTALDYESEFGSDVGDFIRNNFYVDDGLKSVETVDAAIDLIQRTTKLCSKGKLKLHKFVSNSGQVLKAVNSSDEQVESVNLELEDTKIERALGVEWAVKSDVFKFRVVLKDRPFTRRGILSTIASIYDPLGFVAPFTLIGKKILQHLCVVGQDWDEVIPEDSYKQWESWLKDVIGLQDLDIRRCLKPKDFVFDQVEMHHFSDASSTGYGVASYLRFLSKHGDVYVTLALGKARVSPIKPLTIPRLELTAAVMAVKIALVLEREFTYSGVRHYFWTDSKVVLGYIANESRRFHLFVANRIGFIHSNSDVKQWNYVPGTKNVADVASRGCSASALKSSRWLCGPEFLWKYDLPKFNAKVVLESSDPEVRISKVVLSSTTESVFDLRRFEHISSLSRLKKVIALCLKFGRALKLKRENLSGSLYDSVRVSDLLEAELRVVALVQSQAFRLDIKAISSGECLNGSSSIAKLDPFLDGQGILRVGGRIRNSSVDKDLKHPILIPKCGHFTFLLIDCSHSSVKHQGRGMTLNDIRSSGYWIVGGGSAVSKFIHNCVVCRKLRVGIQSPKMSDLPGDRLETGPPFTNVAVDYFGPFYIKEGRKELKRWGVIFTCLSSRAVHLEVASSLTTSSFINALRRFIAIRGPIALLRSDQGTNFVGTRNELRQALQDMDNSEIRDFLLRNGCDFETKFNPPHSSHMGGAWERLIRSVRSILNVMLSQQGSQLDDESLHTFLYEIGAIINSRPLTLEYIHDTDFQDVLTPNHLLTMKSKVVVSPPGDFGRDDIYSIKRWRRVQYMVNVFWTRWKKEYIHHLQSRQKWRKQRRNLRVDDVVVIKDENSTRNSWSLGRVVEVFNSQDGIVRSVKIAVGDSNLDKFGKRVRDIVYWVRPVHKLVLLVES